MGADGFTTQKKFKKLKEERKMEDIKNILLQLQEAATKIKEIMNSNCQLYPLHIQILNAYLSVIEKKIYDIKHKNKRILPTYEDIRRQYFYGIEVVNNLLLEKGIDIKKML